MVYLKFMPYTCAKKCIRSIHTYFSKAMFLQQCCSITISRNTKGWYSWSFKDYWTPYILQINNLNFGQPRRWWWCKRCRRSSCRCRGRYRPCTKYCTSWTLPGCRCRRCCLKRRQTLRLSAAGRCCPIERRQQHCCCFCCCCCWRRRWC